MHPMTGVDACGSGCGWCLAQELAEFGEQAELRPPLAVDRRAFEDRFELAHVARPIVPQQSQHQGLIDGRERGAVAARERLREDRDVDPAFAEGRQAETPAPKTVDEIAAERVVL